MEDRKVAGALTDIGTEELGHLEIVATIIHQLTKDLTPEEIKASGFDKYYIDHTLAIWPQAASGQPVPKHRRYHHRPLRGYGSRAEGTSDLRQYPADREGSGSG